jgi:hypothetical protein
MARPKINTIELTIFAVVLIAVLGLSQFAEFKIGPVCVDALAGFAILFALCGLSVFNSIIPGFIIGAAWGYFDFGSISLMPNIVNCELSVFAALGVYYIAILIKPKSPFNVYLSTMAGSLIHIVITYSLKFCQLSFLFIFLNLFTTVITMVLIVSKLREMGLINHEDPALVAGIEKDLLQSSYNFINRRLNTNFNRPKKPSKC